MITIVKFTAILAIAAILALSPFMTMTALAVKGDFGGGSGMKGYEIAKELNTNESTVSRDIKYLTTQSQNYLNDLAKSRGAGGKYQVLRSAGDIRIFVEPNIPTL